MEQKAYYKPSKPVEEKPPTVISLPQREEPLTFKSSLFTNRYDDKPLVIQKSNDLLEESCATIYLGKGYDGLPLLLRVSRSHPIKPAVLSSLHASDENDLHESIRKPLEELEAAVQKRSCASGIVLSDAKGIKIPFSNLFDNNNETKLSYYKTYNDVGTLIKRTAYSIITGDYSSSSLNERGEGYEEELKTKSTTMHIGVPLSKEAVTPVSVKTYNGDVQLEQLYLENLVNVLGSTKFQCTAQDSSESRYGGGGTSKVYQGLLADRDAYLHALSISSSTELLISRQDLAINVVLQLARDTYGNMHSKGRVHGDIKPANILFLENGPKLIDARGCSIGGICATYTPSWCAPEQTLGKPVTAAADVYAFGMLLLHLVNGEIYGEVKNFKMPSNSSVIQVLDTEGVWINSSIGLDEKARSAWRAALSQYLAFNPSNRPANAKEFADSLEKLIKEFPLTPCKEIHLDSIIGRSSLHRVSVKSKSLDAPKLLKDLSAKVQCEVYPAWVMQDSYPSLA